MRADLKRELARLVCETLDIRECSRDAATGVYGLQFCTAAEQVCAGAFRQLRAGLDVAPLVAAMAALEICDIGDWARAMLAVLGAEAMDPAVSP